MNREQRRKYKRLSFGRVKKSVENWTCPECGIVYPLIFVQSSAEPYLFCHQGCEQYFTISGTNVTSRIFG